MRTIKFRAWDKDSKEMCKPFGLMHDNRELYEDLHIVMQFTGLLDKNGKEIYEGDIVSRFVESEKRSEKRSEKKEREQRFEIVWNEEYAEFEPVMHSTDWRPVLKYILTSPCEVIGNIYENKELLNS